MNNRSNHTTKLYNKISNLIGGIIMTIEINSLKQDDEYIICLKGEADIYTVSQLKSKFLEVTELMDKQPILIDLAELKYIDSTGLGALIGLLKRVKEKGGSVKLLNPQPYIKKILSITGLDKIFNVQTMEENHE